MVKEPTSARLKHTGWLILLLLLVLPSAWALPDKLLQAPIPLLGGGSTSLAEFQGKKPVYLKFWATWCKPCIAQMPHFEHVQQQYGDEIEVIGINLGFSDDLASVKQVLDKYKLTMATAIDQSGDLAQDFHLIGTPYHLLFDRNMNLVHIGHEADASLDNKLALLARSEVIDNLDLEVLSNTDEDIPLDTGDGRSHALFFTATWCDWYLADTRPQVSAACIEAQKAVNQLAESHPEYAWQGLVSRLWTAETDMAEYRAKFDVTHPIAIDRSNRLFHQYGISDLPVLLIVRDGEVVDRIDDFSNRALIEAKLGANQVGPER